MYEAAAPKMARTGIPALRLLWLLCQLRCCLCEAEQSCAAARAAACVGDQCREGVADPRCPESTMAEPGSPTRAESACSEEAQGAARSSPCINFLQLGSSPHSQEEASEAVAGAGNATEASSGPAANASSRPAGNASSVGGFAPSTFGSALNVTVASDASAAAPPTLTWNGTASSVEALLAFGSLLPTPADLVQRARVFVETQSVAVISLTITVVVVVGVLLIAFFGMKGGWPWGQKWSWGEEANEPFFRQQAPESFYRRQPPDLQEEEPRPSTEAPSVVAGPVARRRQRASINASGTCPNICHGLVVPPGSDCVLAIRPARRRGSECVVDISDLRGKPVLKAHIARPHHWGKVDTNILVTMGWNFSHTPGIRLCMLDAVKDGQKSKGSSNKALTLCHGGGGSDGRPTMFIYDSDGRYFGSIAKASGGQSRYVFTAHNSDQSLHFDGLFADNAVCISSPTQYRLAETEPCCMAFDLQNEYYRLRCSGTVDVGLIISCLLSIEEIEAFAPPQ